MPIPINVFLQSQQLCLAKFASLYANRVFHHVALRMVAEPCPQWRISVGRYCVVAVNEGQNRAMACFDAIIACCAQSLMVLVYDMNLAVSGCPFVAQDSTVIG